MASTDANWFVFAGGGTGGHLFPALAVVEELRRRPAPVDISFFCTQRPIDRDILGKAGIEARPLSVQPFPSRPWHWPTFYLRWRESVGVCIRAFKLRRPAAVVGAGGYASGPPMHAALRLGIPAFVLNPDAVPGRANKYMAGRGVSGVFAQWEVTRSYLPAGAPMLVTGCPIRRAFLDATREDGIRHFGLDPARPTLLVTGASQGARTINEALMALAPNIAKAGWQVLHLTGPSDRDRVEAAYRQAGTPAVVLAFTDQMPQAMAAADLVISRAGASSLAEILAIGKPSILFPYPYHKDMHQRHNGQVLVSGGAAVMLDDRKDAAANAASLGPVLGELMMNPARCTAMAEAARRIGRPDAAATIADVLERAADAPAGAPFRVSAADHARNAHAHAA